MIRQPQKITFGEMRETGTRGLLVYCSEYKCGHMMKIAPADADRWPDDMRLSDLQPNVSGSVEANMVAKVRAELDKLKTRLKRFSDEA
jgi:hypothetical protein